MILKLRDSAYTERLASFLRSVGQEAELVGPDTVELTMRRADTGDARVELGIYLRVWNVLHPGADVIVED